MPFWSFTGTRAVESIGVLGQWRHCVAGINRWLKRAWYWNARTRTFGRWLWRQYKDLTRYFFFAHLRLMWNWCLYSLFAGKYYSPLGDTDFYYGEDHGMAMNLAGMTGLGNWAVNNQVIFKIYVQKSTVLMKLVAKIWCEHFETIDRTQFAAQCGIYAFWNIKCGKFDVLLLNM